VQSDWLMDLGHTRVKWVLARQGEVIDESPRSCPLEQLDALSSDLASDQGRRVWLSSQSAPDIVDAVTTLVRNHGLSLQIVPLGAFDMPVKPAYSTLGCDRWLAMQWPWELTGNSFCVIDCGTAVTFDMVNDRGVHLGGWIMAGLKVLRRGLFEQAPGLAELSASGHPSGQVFLPPATDSARAIAAGTMCQVSAALDRALDVATDLFGGTPRVWITGGDGREVADFLNTPATLDDMLVLRGLALAARAS
jgi:type III pantothenate kinase